MFMVLMCFHSKDGIPIFSRKHGTLDFKMLPYSVMASMNGIHMFGKTHEIQLVSTIAKDTVICWKEFHNSITLICVASESTTAIVEQLLQSVFNLMVTIVGLNQLNSIKSTEKLKRDMKIAYPIIDKMMNYATYWDITTNHNNSTLLSISEIIGCTEANSLQTSLESYCESIDTKFGCLLAFGKILVATEYWWQLHEEERSILALLASSNDQHSPEQEMFLFLPYKSSNVIFRYVFCALMKGIQLCVLSGSKPKLNEFNSSIRQHFKTNTDVLHAILQYYPYNLLQTIQIDVEIQSVLIINRKLGKFVLSRNPHYSKINRFQSTAKNRREVLLNFYNRIIKRFGMEKLPSIKHANSGTSNNSVIDNITKEIYVTSDDFKCYAILQDDTYIVCILVSNSIQTFLLRSLAQNAFKNMVSDHFSL